MSNFSIFRIIKESTDPTQIIRGPGVNALKDSMLHMLGQGAPVERNDIGFNQNDYHPARAITGSEEFNNDGMPLKMVYNVLRILNTYKNTQVPHFNNMKKKVEEEIAAAIPEIEKTGGPLSVTVFQDQVSFGKTKVQLSEMNHNQIMGQINRVVNKWCEDHGYRQDYDDYGKLNYHWKDKIKVFSKDKTSPFVMWVHPDILEQVLEIYKNRKYEIKYVGTPKQKSSESQPEDKSVLVKIRVIGVKNTPWGKKIAFAHDMPFQEWNSLKEKLEHEGLWKSAIGFSKDHQGKPEYLLSWDKDGIAKVISILKSKLDTKELEDFVSKIFSVPAETPQSDTSSDETKRNIDFFNAGVDAIDKLSQVKLTFLKFLGGEEFRQVREIIIYTFPQHYKYEPHDKSWTVGGNYQQFVVFGRLLKDFGHDVSKLKDILKEKIKSGELKKTKVEGDVPEETWSIVEISTDSIVQTFKDEKSAQEKLNTMDKHKYKIEHIPAFRNMIEKLLPNKSPDIQLYDAQKEGIEFLFHRNSAILGDETGLGKTIQLIGAAELKMQESGYKRPTLILAINNETARQWAEEIVKVVGKESSHLISLDCHAPNRWTVLNYNLFSHKEKGMDDSGEEKGCISKLVNANFGVAILDELHKVKSEKTKRWQRLEKILERVPTRWGATATISANDAMDVKNQLLVVNHNLGKLADGKFKKDFAGMELKDTPVGKRYVKGSDESRLEAAERLNKWLHLTGVYVRRSKSDIREMPNLQVGEKEVNINEPEYQKKVAERFQKYVQTAKDKGKRIDVAEHLKDMSAQRTELAAAKVPQTIKEVESLLKQGKRIVVFTAFKDSAEMLKRGLSEILPRINSDYKLLTYISSTPPEERALVKKRFNHEQQYRVLLMSLKMGSTGIDFPNAATEMVINDYDWTPEQCEQSEGRIYRINTNQDVNIHYVIAKGTYDESLFAIVQMKRKIAQQIQKTREVYRKEKDSKKSEAILKTIVDLQKKMLAADDKISEITGKESQKVLPTSESFKEFIEWFTPKH